MNIDKSEKEIENDFNSKIEDEQYHPNHLEPDNDYEEDSIQYTIGNTKRDYHETSGLSLLKELEDKWEMIERNKYIQTKAKQFDESNFETNSKSYVKINYKALIDEAKRKFLKKYRLSLKSNDNDEFDTFVKKKVKELEKYKYEAENNDNQFHLTQQQEKLIQDQYDNNIRNHNHDNRDENRYNKHNVRKSFLKEDPIDNRKRKEIPLKYRGNLFNCNERTTIEGLVYESPNTIQEEEEEEKEDSNVQSNINKPLQKGAKEKLNVSIDLVNKIKNVFEEISTPSIPPPLQSSLSTQNNLELPCLTKQETHSLNALDRNFHDILNEINPSLNNRVSRKLKPNTHIEIEDDSYFSNLSKEVSFVKKRNKSVSDGILTNACDRKVSKKIEENVKLLNDVLVTEKIPRRKYYNIGNNNLLNSTLLNCNSNNTSILDANYNKICSKNQFDDSISKIYKANALKINKLLKTAGNCNRIPNNQKK